MDLDIAVEELEDEQKAHISRVTNITINNITNHSSSNGFNLTNPENLNYYYFYSSIQFTVMWILFVAIVVLNASVIAALLCTDARKSRMNFFIMHLAIADLLVGLIYVLIDILQKIFIAWLAGEFMCKLVRFLQTVVVYASTYVLVALSIDRCDAITNPMNFSGSWNRARALIISAWVLSTVFSIPMLILYEVREVQGQLQCWIDLGTPIRWQIWVTLASTLVFVIPALAITACYTVIVLTIWTKSKAVVMSPPVNSRRKTMRNGHVDNEPDSRRASSRGLIPRAKIKSVKMTFVIVFVFVLCWSPYIVFDLLQVYKFIPWTQTSLAVATLIQSLAPLNSAANPLICCMFSPHIYLSLRRIPPYRWFWWGRRSRRCGRSTLRSRSESTANSDLLSSMHGKRSHSIALSLNRTRSNSVPRNQGDNRRTQMVILTSPRN